MLSPDTPNSTSANALVIRSPHDKGQNGSRRGRSGNGRGGYRNTHRGHWGERKKSQNDNENDLDSDKYYKKGGISKTRGHSTNICCFYCCRWGHKESDCLTKKRAQKMKARNENFSTAKFIQVDSDPESTGNIADAAGLACCTILEGSQNHINFKAWHIDSGASDHISNQRSAFIDIRHLDIPIRIRMGNNTIITAVEIGSVLLTTTKNGNLRHLIFSDVLYAPDLGTNLLSV